MNRAIGTGVADLVVVVLVTLVLAEVMTFELLGNGPVRILLGVPFALFLPGYAFISFLFPRSADEQNRHGIDWPERLALAFATSVAILPITMLALSASPLGLTTGSIAGALTGIVLLGSILAGWRRLTIPGHERVSLPSLPTLGEQGGYGKRSRSSLVLHILLIASIILAGSAVSYAFAAPQMSNSFTEFYVLHENPDGERVAGGYPDQLIMGQSASFVVGIENRESATQAYTVVVQLQDLEGETVTDRTELTRYETQVGPGDRAERELTVTPQAAGQDLRLTYLLYKGTPPEEPTSENAYRRLHTWVTVLES